MLEKQAIIKKCKKDIINVKDNVYKVNIRGVDYELRELYFDNVIKAQNFSSKMNLEIENVLAMRSLMNYSDSEFMIMKGGIVNQLKMFNMYIYGLFDETEFTPVLNNDTGIWSLTVEDVEYTFEELEYDKQEIAENDGTLLEKSLVNKIDFSKLSGHIGLKLQGAIQTIYGYSDFL